MRFLTEKFLKHSTSRNDWEKQEKLVLSLLVLFLFLLFLSFVIEEETVWQQIPVPSQKPIDITQIIETNPEEQATPTSLLPRRFRVKLHNKESLTTLFARLRLDTKEVDKLVKSVGEADRRALSRLRSDTFFYITLNADESLKQLVVMDDDAIHGTSYLNAGDGVWRRSKYVAEHLKEHRYLGGDISSSLYRNGLDLGMSDALVIRFAEIFAYDIDFANDVRKGDQFSMLLEDTLVDNRMVQEDTVVLARFVNRGKEITAIRYTNKNGDTGYFTPNGESMRTRFLRMPVKFSRVSSRFNRKRKHPILGTVRPHTGTDFAARTGTPINAAGNGVLSYVGRKGGYGKTVIINHGSGYTTLYGHMHGYARGMSRGKRVKQGDVIGYVGSTGLSTGPHLHYEFRINGVHHNPLTVRLPRRAKLAKDELESFRGYAKELMSSYEQQELAYKEGQVNNLSRNAL